MQISLLYSTRLQLLKISYVGNALFRFSNDFLITNIMLSYSHFLYYEKFDNN